MERHSLICGPEDLLAAERWVNEGGMIAPEDVLRRERQLALAAQPSGTRPPEVCEADESPPNAA